MAEQNERTVDGEVLELVVLAQRGLLGGSLLLVRLLSLGVGRGLVLRGLCVRGGHCVCVSVVVCGVCVDWVQIVERRGVGSLRQGSVCSRATDARRWVVGSGVFRGRRGACGLVCRGVMSSEADGESCMHAAVDGGRLSAGGICRPLGAASQQAAAGRRKHPGPLGRVGVPT